MNENVNINSTTFIETGKSGEAGLTRPWFITFEGVEGVGKSTQIKQLSERLNEFGIDSIMTREPGGTVGAEAIRHVILSGVAEGLGADVEAMLFAAARADHVDQIIKPALNSGKWVLCDRFTDSTRVFQGEDGVEMEFIDQLEQISLLDTKPDLTFIIDLPVSIGIMRVIKRQISETGPLLDRFEREDRETQEKRRQAFLKLAQEYPDRCVVVDGMRDSVEVSQEIWNSVCRVTGLDPDMKAN